MGGLALDLFFILLGFDLYWEDSQHQEQLQYALIFTNFGSKLTLKITDIVLISAQNWL